MRYIDIRCGKMKNKPSNTDPFLFFSNQMRYWVWTPNINIMESLIGKKVKITKHLEDHEGYGGQELKVIAELENDYITVTDGVTEWCAGIEETDLFD